MAEAHWHRRNSSVCFWWWSVSIQTFLIQTSYWANCPPMLQEIELYLLYVLSYHSFWRCGRYKRSFLLLPPLSLFHDYVFYWNASRNVSVTRPFSFFKIYLFSKVTRIPPSEIRRPVNTCRFFSFKTPIVFQSDVTDFTFIFFSTDEFDFWNKKRGASDRICLKRMRLGWVSSIYLIWQSEVWVRCESEKEILLSCHVVELSTALEMRLLKEEKEYILITKEE